MVFKKDLIKFKKKYKIHTIRKDIKNLKYVKTIKMYKILKMSIMSPCSLWNLRNYVRIRKWQLSVSITSNVTNKKNEPLWKTVRLKGLQNHNQCNPFQSSSSLIHPCLLMYLQCYWYLLSMFWAVIFMFYSVWWQFSRF